MILTKGQIVRHLNIAICLYMHNIYDISLFIQHVLFLFGLTSCVHVCKTRKHLTESQIEAYDNKMECNVLQYYVSKIDSNMHSAHANGMNAEQDISRML